MYFHGGGFVIGDIETYDGLCRYIADRTQMQVLSVDYRLGPEHRFPAGHKDTIAVAQAVISDPGAYAPGATHVAVGGDSAGACLSLMAGQNVQGIHALWLLYPVCDFVNDYPSLTEMGSGFGLSKDMIHWFSEHFIDNPDYGDPLASPLLCDSWENVPKTWVSGAGFDPLLDQSSALADKLRSQNVDVTYVVEADMIHAYANLFGLSQNARAALDRACDWLSGAMDQKTR
nr:alpha/beta hydrolase [Sulfitobacter algicola]